MRSILRVVTALAGCVLFGTSQAIDFPPLGDRYANIPEEAEDAYKSLKRLEARTEIGVNYVDYNRVIGDTFPDVKLFLESREAKQLPELAFVLGNAMDCYREVNRLWGIKVTSDVGILKYNASITLITAQPMLWRVAATNLSGAKAILESEPGELEAAQKLIAASSDRLTLEGGLQAAIDEEVRLSREMRAKNTGCPIPPGVGGPGFQEQLLPDGKVDETFAAEAMTNRLPRFFDNVPPASEERSGNVTLNGEHKGLIAVFRYDDPAVTAKAYDALLQHIGSDRKPYAGLGNLASVAGEAAVFCRGRVIVYMQGSVPQAPMLGMLAAIDARAKKAFGDGEAIAPMTAAAANDLAGLLLAEDDLKKGIGTGGFEEGRHPVFESLPESNGVGLYSLTADGSRIGCIAAVEYDSRETAADHFATWTARRRSRAKVSRVSGLGSKSYRRESDDSVEFFFFRNQYLVYINGPKTFDKEVSRVARRIDVRIRATRAGAADDAEDQSDSDENQTASE